MSFKVNLKDIALLKNGKKITKKESGRYEIFGANGQIGYSDEFLLEKESIVLGRVGANCGSVHYSSNPIWISDNTIGVVPKDNVDGYYLYYILSSLRLNEMAAGSAQPLINQSIINSIALNLINLDEQKKVGAFLRYIDEKIKINKEIISTLEKISQSLFKQWFIDFEFPNEEGKPYKSSGGEMVESELGEIPKGWKFYNVNEFAKSISNSINKKEKQYAKFLNTSDVLDGEIADVDFLPTKDMPGQAKKLIEQNDILYSEIRPKNKRYAYIQIQNADDYVVSTKLMVLRTNEEILSSKLFYIWLTLQSTINELNQIAESRSGTFPQITFSILSKFKLALPPKNLMDVLTATVTPLLNEIYELRSENKKLVELRDTLLPKLLSGEIEIPDDLEV